MTTPPICHHACRRRCAVTAACRSTFARSLEQICLQGRTVASGEAGDGASAEPRRHRTGKDAPKGAGRREQRRSASQFLIGVLDDGCPFAAAQFLRPGAWCRQHTGAGHLGPESRTGSRSTFTTACHRLCVRAGTRTDFNYGVEFRRDFAACEHDVDDRTGTQTIGSSCTGRRQAASTRMAVTRMPSFKPLKPASRTVRM